MLKSRLLGGLLLFGLTWAPLPGQGVLKVGIDVAEPWKIQDDSGALSGAEVDLFRALGQKLRVKIELVPLPFKRCLVYMETGQIDMMSGLLREPGREAYILFVAPAYKTRSNKAFYTLAKNRISISTYEDLYGHSIGVKSGVKLFPRFDQDRTLLKSEGQSFEQLVQMLLAERFEVLAMTDSVADHWIGRLDGQGRIVKAAYGFSHENAVFLGVSRKSAFAHRIEEIQRVVADMIKSGELDRIFVAFFRTHRIPVPVYK